MGSCPDTDIDPDPKDLCFTGFLNRRSNEIHFITNCDQIFPRGRRTLQNFPCFVVQLA